MGDGARYFVYVLRPARPAMLAEGLTTAERETVGAHLAYLQRLAAEKVVILFGRTDTSDERTFGLVIFRAGSEIEARGVMEGDPAVARGVMTAEVFPYRLLHVEAPA